MSGQDVIIQLMSLLGPRKLIGDSYKDIRLAIPNYISPKERVVTADNFQACLREEARYCDFEKPKTAANPDKESVKIKFLRFEGP